MANSTQVVRIKTHDRLLDANYRHYSGRIRPHTARPVDPPVHIFVDDLPASRLAVDMEGYRRRRGRHGRPAKQAVDFMFAGPPRYGTPEEWSADS